MPGYLPGIPGLIAFEAVKFGGYVLACELIKRAQPAITASRYKMGAVRTGLGILIGLPAMIGLSWMFSFWGVPDPTVTIAFFVVLFGLSLSVWALVIRIFTRRAAFPNSALWRYSMLAAGWSLLLDVAGVALAMIAPGKVSFC